MVNRVLTIIVRYPGLVLTGLLLITVLALSQLVDAETGAFRLSVDPSVGQLLPADDPDRDFYERARHIFGSEESVVVALATNDSFSAENLARIERMTERLETLPGAHSVLSLTTAKSLRADEFGIEFTGSGDRDFTDIEVRERLRADIMDNPMYVGTLVSDDGRVSALVVNFKGLDDAGFIENDIATTTRAIADEERGDATVWVSGSPIIKASLSKALMDSFRITVPAIIGIVAFLLLLAFRSIRAVVLPVLAIVISLIWTLALVAWLGLPLNVVTTLVPPLVITLGLAYCMHVVSEYYTVAAEARTDDRRHVVFEVLQQVSMPLIISGATTAAGLLALLFNSLTAIREFSLLSFVGITLTVFVVLTLIPAGLCYLPLPRKTAAHGSRAFTRAARVLVKFSTRHRRSILMAGLALLALAAVGTSRIEVGTEYIGGFEEDARVRTDFEGINETFGGANSFYIVIESPEEDTFVDPSNLARLASLQDWLAEQPEVGSSTSLVNHIKLINQTLHDGESAFYAIPDNRQLAKQLLLFGGSEDLDGYVDSTYRMTNILVRIRVDDTREISRLLERTRQRLEQLPYPLEARVTGNIILMTRTVADIAAGQLLSIGVALLVVLLILALVFTSFRIGTMALFPNLLAVGVYFGTLGLLGITLSPTTSLIACIALGIAVDDSIHFMVRFNTEARASGEEGTAVQRALIGVIRPVTYTSLVLVLSFLVMTTSELKTQVHFGALAAFTIAVAWLMDLTLTPALSAGMRVVTLWDLLRLDLGPDPQSTIPFFRGLNKAQARVFALMADIQGYGAGSRIISEGERASDEVFLVLDGELRASVGREDREIELSRMKRGAIMGEGGAFGGTRSASVDAVTDVRLLRFTTEHLENLRKRYPRIAALIYRNLNFVQADRMARDMSRIS
jgi:predicted RND superfamily exporter protein